jgi:hypothetical protein
MNPIIPGIPADRTGTLSILRRAVREIERRWTGLQADVLAIFDAIPVYAINAGESLDMFRYGLTAEQMVRLSTELQAAVERWIADGRDPANLFWWSQYVAETQQLGTAQTVANLGNLSPAYAAARSIEMVIYSEPYVQRLALAQFKSYEHWTGLAAQQKSELARLIGQAVVDGRNPRAVAETIKERLGVSLSKAKSYAQTDITDTLRQARWAEAEQAQQDFGIRIGLLWTSALLPTTRQSHAAKHGRILTQEAVRDFYGRDGNRYNCFLPGTKVAGRFVAGSRARYKGPVVTLVRANGEHLTVTPNHPVMTRGGLVAAAEVKKGDYLVADRTKIENAARVTDLNGDLVEASIEDVFGALQNLGKSFFVRVGGVDFHGDAALMDEYINVVRSESVLPFAVNAARSQLLDNLKFVKSDSSGFGHSFFDPLLVGNEPTNNGGMGGGSVGAALGRCHVGAPDPLRITHGSCLKPGEAEPFHDACAAVARPCADGENRFSGHVGGMELSGKLDASFLLPLVDSKSVSLQQLHNRSVTDSGALSDAFERLSGLVSLDEVTDVFLSEYDGHVFDLEEVSGLMIADNCVVSNCHCSTTEALLDADGKPILTPKLRAKMQGEKTKWDTDNPS